jgi:ribonuclease-3
LQEYIQAANAGQPQYVVTSESGPDHRKRFCVEVRIVRKNGAAGKEASGQEGTVLALARAEGSTKKQAQQEAAKIAYERLIHEKLLASTASAVAAEE